MRLLGKMNSVLLIEEPELVRPQQGCVRCSGAHSASVTSMIRLNAGHPFVDGPVGRSLSVDRTSHTWLVLKSLSDGLGAALYTITKDDSRPYPKISIELYSGRPLHATI